MPFALSEEQICPLQVLGCHFSALNTDLLVYLPRPPLANSCCASSSVSICCRSIPCNQIKILRQIILFYMVYHANGLFPGWSIFCPIPFVSLYLASRSESIKGESANLELNLGHLVQSPIQISTNSITSYPSAHLITISASILTLILTKPSSLHHNLPHHYITSTLHTIIRMSRCGIYKNKILIREDLLVLENQS